MTSLEQWYAATEPTVRKPGTLVIADNTVFLEHDGRRVMVGCVQTAGISIEANGRLPLPASRKERRGLYAMLGQHRVGLDLHLELYGEDADLIREAIGVGRAL